jgi:lipid II:glycine glycyltransferase (peptidoglycan interpeptide bridge formation enzyme)
MDSSRLIHWSSKRISLDEDAETIFKKFSENHRRNIKKATSLQIECRKIVSKPEMDAFIRGYIQMYRHRKLDVDAVAVENSFSKLFEYVTRHKSGFFIGAFRGDDLLGGLIVIFQGNTAFYYKGYIDHEQRKVPINHLAFYEAILLSKEDNLHWFDFGGYASNTTDEQLVNINKFKDGFKGTTVEFPKTQMIGLNYFSGWVQSLLSLKQSPSNK